MRVLHDGHARAERIAHPATALLDHMREFMAQQPLAVCAMRAVLPWREVDIRPHREGHRPDLLGLRTFVDAHGREVFPEESFHLPLDCRGEGLTPHTGFKLKRLGHLDSITLSAWLGDRLRRRYYVVPKSGIDVSLNGMLDVRSYLP